INVGVCDCHDGSLLKPGRISTNLGTSQDHDKRGSLMNGRRTDVLRGLLLLGRPRFVGASNPWYLRQPQGTQHGAPEAMGGYEGGGRGGTRGAGLVPAEGRGGAKERTPPPPCLLHRLLAREERDIAAHGVTQQPLVRLHRPSRGLDSHQVHVLAPHGPTGLL